jgi:hypothetical protein
MRVDGCGGWNFVRCFQGRFRSGSFSFLSWRNLVIRRVLRTHFHVEEGSNGIIFFWVRFIVGCRWRFRVRFGTRLALCFFGG